MLRRRAAASSTAGSGRAQERHVVGAREKRGPARAQVFDDRVLALRAREQRLPAEQMRRLVEVAARDRGQAVFRDPGEELAAVEELPAVDERAELSPVAREPLRRTGGNGVPGLVEIRVGGDERRPGLAGANERGLEPGPEVDEVAEPDCDRVRG